MFVDSISMKTASCGPHGAYSFEVASRFFLKLCTPGLKVNLLLLDVRPEYGR